jgi:hypothetical protein
MRSRLVTIALALQQLTLISASLSLILSSLSPQVSTSSAANSKPLLLEDNRSCTVTVFSIYPPGNTIVRHVYYSPNGCGQAPGTGQLNETSEVFHRLVFTSGKN